MNNVKYFETLNKIVDLKENLAKTDYLAIKHSEGLITPAEYLTIKTQRQAWRDEINLLETKLKLLRGE